MRSKDVPSSQFFNLFRSIPIQCLCLALFFGVYHKLLVYWMREASINLGAVRFNRHVPPLYAVPQPNLSLWILPALVILIGFLLFCRRIFLQRVLSTRRLFFVAIASFIVIGISVGMIDGYREVNGQPVAGLLEPYTRTQNEYYGDVPKVDQHGFAKFLGDYPKPEVFKTLSGHAQTHPPGGVIFLWLISKLFGYNLLSASLASIAFTSLTVIPIYLLARDRYGESVSRYALPLFLITPNFVMFTTTSMDGPFSVFPIWSVYLFYQATGERGSEGKQADRQTGRYAIRNTQYEIRHTQYAIGTGIALALGMFMTYSTVFIGVFLGAVAVLTLMFNREQFKHILTVLLITGGTFVGFYVLMFLFTRFNLLEAVWTSIKKDEAGMGTGYESIGRYFHLSFANLFAFLIGIGIPLTVVWIRQIIRAIRDARHDRGLDIYVIGYLMSLLVITFSTLFTMEVERIWIFMSVFIVIPVAKYLHELCEEKQSTSDFHWVAGLLCVQLILFEVMLYTYW